MSNVDVPQENDSPENEIESPVDGPTPDWLKMATSSSSAPSLTEENTPDWLKTIQAGKGMAEEEKTTEPEQDPYEGLSDLERLLAEEGVDLGSVSEERPEGAEGMSARDWMIATSDDEVIRKRIGAEDEDTAEDDPFAGLSDIERLLAEEGVDLSSVSEERPEGAQGMSARDWMISTSDDEVIRKRIGAESTQERPTPVPAPKPAPQSAPTPSAPPDDSDSFGDEDDLPDWLRDIEETPASPASSMADQDVDDSMVIEDDLPDWLQEMEDESDISEPIDDDEDDMMVVEEDLPDWLRDIDEEPAAAETTPSAPSSPPRSSAEQSDLPDWLQDVEETSPAAAPSFAEEDEDDKMVFEDELPDWLREEAAEEPEEPEEARPAPQPFAALESDEDDDQMVVEDDLPDWLREAGEASPAAPQTSEAQEDDMPSWLQEVETRPEPDVVPDIESVTATTVADEQLVDEEGLPDWLREVEEEEADEDLEEDLFEAEAASVFDEETIEVDELPDWLSEAQVVEDEPFEPSEPSPEDLITAVDEEDLPDWLREVQDEHDELEFADEGAPAPMFESEQGDFAVTAEDEELIETDELPDWLQEVEEETEVFTEKDVPAPVSQPVDLEPEPEPVAEEAAPVEETPKAPAPVEAPPAAKPKPVAPSPKTPGVVPDWLKKLREGDRELTRAAPAPVQPLPVATSQPPPAARPQPAVAARVSVPAAAPKAVAAATEMPSYDDLPQDPGTRLKMAQTAKDKGDFEEATRIYGSLIHSNTHLETIIEDMELAIRSYPSNYLLYQVMGDAMMRDGRLQSALEAYRTALEKLAA